MHLAREEAILQSHLPPAGRKAYDAMTMDDVANAVGIAKASLYKHFSSKEGVVQCSHGADSGECVPLMGLPQEMPPVESCPGAGALVAGAAHHQRCHCCPAATPACAPCSWPTRITSMGWSVSDQIGEWIVQAQARA